MPVKTEGWARPVHDNSRMGRKGFKMTMWHYFRKVRPYQPLTSLCHKKVLLDDQLDLIEEGAPSEADCCIECRRRWMVPSREKTQQKERQMRLNERKRMGIK